MQVNEILDKITERNAPVVGCIARKGNKMHHNLEDFGLDCGRIADTVQDLLSISDLIEDGGSKIDTVFTEYDGHCLIGQRIEDSLLVTVSDHVQRAGFKKLQVGLSLQTRMLSKALDEAPEMVVEAAPEPVAEPEVEAVAEPPAAPERVIEAPKKKSAWNSLMRAVGSAPAESAAEETPVNTEGKTRKVYRGQVYWE